MPEDNAENEYLLNAIKTIDDLIEQHGHRSEPLRKFILSMPEEHHQLMLTYIILKENPERLQELIGEPEQQDPEYLPPLSKGLEDYFNKIVGYGDQPQH